MGLSVSEDHFYTSALATVLVLSGVTTPEIITKFPYRPKYVLRDVGEIAGIED